MFKMESESESESELLVDIFERERETYTYDIRRLNTTYYKKKVMKRLSEDVM
jgi:hypothetical protein